MGKAVVVAEEVRKLAEESSQSTQQIGDLITEINNETVTAVETTGEGKQATDEGIILVSVAGESFHEIANSIESVSKEILEVESAVKKIIVKFKM